MTRKCLFDIYQKVFRTYSSRRFVNTFLYITPKVAYVLQASLIPGVRYQALLKNMEDFIENEENDMDDGTEEEEEEEEEDK